MSTEPNPRGEGTPIPVRQSTPRGSAVVFVHGFCGDVQDTWQNFPAYLRDEPALAGWDIWLLGYPTHLTVDVLGVWSADPGIGLVAERLVTDVTRAVLAGYSRIAFIAHSMGGLVVQRALVDSVDLRKVTTHVLLFGTPSAGLKKASLGWLLKPQLRHMSAGGEFIEALRARWTTLFGAGLPFAFTAVAGDRDQFVPASSSLDPFRDPRFPQRTAVAPGNHVELVKPASAADSCVRLVVNTLAGGTAAAVSPLDAACVAVELNGFQAAIDKLLPRAATLDSAARVQLAIALDGVGRRDEAIQVLRDAAAPGTPKTDAMGTLAGRLKRRWLADRTEADAREALALYTQARDLARQAGDAAQAYYLGINVAFLQFAYEQRLDRARTTAAEVLADCAAVEAQGAETRVDSRWRLAAEGEALLLRGDTAAATKRYTQALGTGTPEPWQVASMRLQALHLAHLLGEKPLADTVDAVFRAPRS
jgi:hypothetical protein